MRALRCDRNQLNRAEEFSYPFFMGVLQSTQAMGQYPDTNLDDLQRLPLELQHKIFGFLDYPSALFLTATCRSLRDSPKRPLSFQSVADKESFLVQAENFPHHVVNLEYACFRCHCIRPYKQFAKNQVSGKRNKLRERCKMRFCIDCGLTNNIYIRGSRVRKADGTTIFA